VPAMPCHTLETLVDDPHLTAVGLVGRDSHPTEGDIRTIRPTILRDGATADPGDPAQPIGWDTRAVLGELGLAPAAIDALFASGATHEAQRVATMNSRGNGSSTAPSSSVL
jgi:crotonobetainyl-CoA:carnitine CoA-transferase CaiB-like acyl-CoA transferase